MIKVTNKCKISKKELRLGTHIKKVSIRRITKTRIQGIERMKPLVQNIGEFLFPMVKMNRIVRRKK